MSNLNQFKYSNSTNLSGVSLLDACMTNFSYSRHTHEEYSFGATCKGEQHFSSDGEFHRSLAGNVIIFNPDTAHDGQSGGDDHLLYSMLYVSPERMQPMLRAANISDMCDFRFEERTLHAPVLHRKILGLSALIRDSQSGAADQEAALFDIALNLAKLTKAQDQECVKHAVDWRLARIKEYIHASLASDITLESLAAIAGFSKYHFLRYFRNQTGITPWQYIINYRVNQARVALENGAELADVVFNFGFSDHSHFNRQFKSIYGITPKKWQKSFFNR